MLIEMTMVASAMILIGVILRALFINHIPKMTFMLIWGLVVIRLLIPFSIPSLWGQYQVVIPVIENLPTREVNLPLPEAQGNPSSGEKDSTWNSPTASINWMKIIWISGVAISGGYIISNHYKFRKHMSDALPVGYKFRENIQIKETDKIDSPLTYGVFNPVILMPEDTDWTNEEQLSLILTHEYVHIRRKDYLTKILLAAVLCVHWFNPLVWVMYILANRDIELACDEAVLKILGRSKRSAYAMTLLEMEEKRNQIPVLAFSKNATEERVQVMINMKKKTSLLGAALALILVGGAMTVFASSDKPIVTNEAKQSVSGTYTILDEINFMAFVEQNRDAVDTLWGDIEEEMRVIENGGVVILQPEVRHRMLEKPEFATAESFSAWMEQRLNSLEGLATRRELNNIRTEMEATLSRLENGESVIINSDGDWYLELGIRVDWEDFVLCVEDFMFTDEDTVEAVSEETRLTYAEFEVWAEQDLSRREASGEYTAEEIEILRTRYSDLLVEYSAAPDVLFIIVDDELWGIGFETSATDVVESVEN